MPRLGPLAAVAALVPGPAAFGQPVTRADLKPGLVTTAADGPAAVTRLDPAVGLALAPGEAVHPKLGAGATVRWDGYLNVLLPGTYRFAADLSGAVAVTVGGDQVLAGQAAGPDARRVEGRELALPAGFHPIRVAFDRTAPAGRLTLLWQGPGFRVEPVPHYALGHRPGDRPPGFAADRAREHGRLLFEELGCGRCHQPAADDPMSKTLADRAGPDLTDVGKRAYPGWLDAWLADPHKLRPDAAMPKLFAADDRGRAERYAVAAYLSSLGGPAPAPKPAGVGSGSYQRSVGQGQRLYLTAGCAACHGDGVSQPPAKPKPKDDEDETPALRPEDSAYAAGSAGPQGFYLLGAVGSKFPADALAKYLQDPLATHPHGRMPNMTLSGQEAQDLARFLARVTDDGIPRDLPPEPAVKPAELVPGAGDWKAAGKRLLTAKGCVNCHAVPADAKGVADPGGRLAPRVGAARPASGPPAPAGCLADRPDPAKVPIYHLAAGQRADLLAFLADGLVGAGSPAPAYHARVALKRFNCLNCHSRDGEGGLPADLADKMKLLEKADNADDVSPPRLTGVGHKLTSAWADGVLLHAGRARPWMSLRMPQYGPGNVGFLPAALPKLDGAGPEPPAKAGLTAAKVEAGRTLAGKDGHGCVACHDISGVTGGGTRGPDLARTHERVRRDWYGRWLHGPQRLAPGTRMPTYFENGKAQNPAVLGGDADAQIDALWAYLSLGPGLPLPAGMEPPRGVVVAVGGRPEVVRTFLPGGAGPKAVAVGYPGGVNVAFDAAACRLAYAWTGNFLDASPAWANRGGAPAKPLGPTFWEAPAGFPWALTGGDAPPDFPARAADPAYGYHPKTGEFYDYDPRTDPPTPDRLGTWLRPGEAAGGRRLVHFGGYAVGPTGAPAFRYRLDAPAGGPGLSVAETPGPLPVGAAAGLTRAFAVDRPAGETAWLLAAEAAGGRPRVVGPDGAQRALPAAGEPAAGVRVVVPAGGRATVLEATAAPPGAVWQYVPAAGGTGAVLLRLPATGPTRAEVKLSVWGLPRDDEELLKGLRGK